ncbi:TonB-dependent receptor [Niastella koreensis GR20-10]|uniref:TonB-dependent receptor n=1 Tax=Niastella koreensis (strain DSM 17620 / KACC 11465 / NBRC 106392 / GR20-10) TaxID=700598 RepID=G8TM70_NIAKG|nr:TonB-dependent receptor [Niastella koreensis]AEV99843.1 TonB-dependent receptor [Niastella koreensis GR20-10]
MSPSVNRWKAICLLSRAATLFCLLAFILPLTAQTANPLKKTVLINVDQQPLEKVLTDIAIRVQVKFAFDVSDVRQYTVTLHEKKEITVEEALRKVLGKTSLDFESHANTVVIYNKEKKPANSSTVPEQPGSNFISYSAGSQVFTGTVTDDAAPLSGVTLTIKGTTVGTQTDSKGAFRLEADGETITVIVSYVGYAIKEVILKAGAPNFIKLEPEETQLNTVVVVGYGTQKRGTFSGAQTDVKLDKVASRSVHNFTELLQGKAPGVIVQNEGGDPTSLPSVSIRGLGGINGEKVLYVVDGVVTDGVPVVNPNEIENISVLKDASAAIYGARASGGVILITTKKGKSGAASITVDAKYGAQKAWRKLQPLNAKEYADMMNLAADNAGKPRSPAFDATTYPDGQITRTNWMDDIFRTGHINDYNVNINGGSDKSKYFMGFGYRKAEGTLLNTYTERYNFRLNSDHQLKPWLKVGENLQYTFTNGNGANTQSAYTGAILSAIFYPPSVAPYNADGTYAGLPATYAGSYGDVINPVAYLNRLDYKNPVNGILINPYVDIKLHRNLTFRSNFALTKSFSTAREFDTRVLEIGKIFDFNQLSISNDNYTNLLAEQTLTYNKEFGEHHVTAVAGYVYQHELAEGAYAQAQDFTDERVVYRYFQNANDIFKPQSYKTEKALVSYLARVNYDYQEKYLLTLLGRRDGTSLVAKGNKFANYYAVTGGWVISREAFMHGINWLNNLKLRTSYGLLGNLGSLPANSVNVPMQPTTAYMGQDPAQVYGYAEDAISNLNMKWAQSRQYNVGADVAVLDNRLSLNADYFIKNTENMLYRRPPASTNGVNYGKWDNVGEAQDKGIELGINYNGNPKAAFQYSIGATITKVSNKLVSLTDNITTVSTADINIRSTLAPVIMQVGSPLWSYYVVPTAGIFKTQDEVNNYKNKNGALIQPNAKPGDLKFVDVSGNGKIDDSDRVIRKGNYPNFTYGFSFNASYKNFDLNFFVQGVQGNKIFNGLKYLAMQAGASGQNYNMLHDVVNAWTPENPNAAIPRVSLTDANGNFSTVSDWYLDNGSYARIKNVTLGYTLPGKLTNRVKINTLRVYVTANNLVTITKYKGFDPEVGMNEYGIDKGRYPQARSVFVGVNVNF